jgi:hypothetical protein
MREAEDSFSNAVDPLLRRAIRSRGFPHRSRQSIVAGDDSRGLQFWIQVGLPLIRLSELEPSVCQDWQGSAEFSPPSSIFSVQLRYL